LGSKVGSGEWDQRANKAVFRKTFPISFNFGAVITAVICSVSPDLTELVEAEILHEQKRVFK
jgi:hypothetical protein